MKIKDRRKLLTQKDYSKISEIYAVDFGNDRDHFVYIDDAIELLQKRNLSRSPCIDLGCGTGTVTDYLIEKGLTNIIAVDLTPEFCEIVKNKHKNKVKVINEDMSEIIGKFEDSSIAAYFANFSIIHIPDEEIDDLLKSITQTLLPGGLFVMSCHKGTFKGMEQEPYQTQKDSRLRVKEKLFTYMNYFTEGELRKRVAKAGMQIVKLETFEPETATGELPVPKIWLLSQKQVLS